MHAAGLLCAAMVFATAWLIAHVRWHTDTEYRQKWERESFDEIEGRQHGRGRWL